MEASLQNPLWLSAALGSLSPTSSHSSSHPYPCRLHERAATWQLALHKLFPELECPTPKFRVLDHSLGSLAYLICLACSCLTHAQGLPEAGVLGKSGLQSPLPTHPYSLQSELHVAGRTGEAVHTPGFAEGRHHCEARCGVSKPHPKQLQVQLCKPEPDEPAAVGQPLLHPPPPPPSPNPKPRPPLTTPPGKQAGWEKVREGGIWGQRPYHHPRSHDCSCSRHPQKAVDKASH